MRETAGNAAATAARCRNRRREGFMMVSGEGLPIRQRVAIWATSLVISRCIFAQGNLGGLVPDPKLCVALFENDRHTVERGERLGHVEIALGHPVAVPIGPRVDGVA